MNQILRRIERTFILLGSIAVVVCRDDTMILGWISFVLSLGLCKYMRQGDEREGSCDDANQA